MKRRNVLRELIQADKPTISTHVHSIWPGVAEVIGHSGAIDYVEFTGQYAPFDLLSLENFGRAIDLFDHMSSMMKLNQDPRTFLAQRAMGSGIDNLLFADIRNVDDAREAVMAVRPDTPEAGGKAGVTSTRDVGYVFPGITIDDYIQSHEESVVALMIEKKGAVENLEEILSIGGVDMVQFGPSDYSINIGIPGQYDHPDVLGAEQRTIETALKMGVRPRAEISSWEEAQPYLDKGVKDFSIGTDLKVIFDYCQGQGEALAKAIGR